MTLLPAADTAAAKKVHGKRPVRTNKGYGAAPAGTFARRPKKMVKTIIIINGWSTAQATPRAVCLYRTLTSRQARKKTSSRAFQSSRTFKNCQPTGGSITVSEGIEGNQNGLLIPNGQKP